MLRRDRHRSYSGIFNLVILSGLIVIVIAIWSSLPSIESTPPEPEEKVSLLFIGDIMGHGSQIRGALDDSTGTYSYNHIFSYIKEIISNTDFAIANLELTLGGPPFSSYPKFSSPDAIATACSETGIDCLVLANNHIVDRGSDGLVRTIRVIDSLGLRHTGAFSCTTDRQKNNPLYLEKNSVKIALLNYTYAVNGALPIAPVSVNMINRNAIKRDIVKAQTDSADIIVTLLHFGNEYKSNPDSIQVNLVNYLFNSGSDIIIGTHPHVIQPMQLINGNDSVSTKFVAYSLGNFVSGQRRQGTEGGVMVSIEISKSGNRTKISDAGYYLTWVDRKYQSGKIVYSIVPCAEFENDTVILEKTSKERMVRFISESRSLLKDSGIKEIVPDNRDEVVN
jgi:poly-gamma-glutamate synthesis protein (capsule biosynthesis protein)